MGRRGAARRTRKIMKSGSTSFSTKHFGIQVTSNAHKSKLHDTIATSQKPHFAVTRSRLMVCIHELDGYIILFSFAPLIDLFRAPHRPLSRWFWWRPQQREKKKTGSGQSLILDNKIMDIIHMPLVNKQTTSESKLQPGRAICD